MTTTGMKAQHDSTHLLGRQHLLIGMVHLDPLPGGPRYGGSFDIVVERAVADAMILASAGFDAVMIENFGDAPFRKNRVEPHTVAAMTAAAIAIRSAVSIPIGINVLRNDALSALAVAGTVGAAFIRVNILAGTMVTDQGIIEGEAPEVAVYRARVAPEVAILADVHVKHALPLVERPINEMAVETVQRAGADGLIVTGTGTGNHVDMHELRLVRDSVDAPVFAGSGVTTENVADLLKLSNGAIVGSGLKVDGNPLNRVERSRAEAFVKAARG